VRCGDHGQQETGAALGEDRPMPNPTPDLQSDDWRRIRDALRYLGRDLHHRSFAVSAERRSLLWEEMDRCLLLAERLEGLCADADPQDISHTEL